MLVFASALASDPLEYYVNSLPITVGPQLEGIESFLVSQEQFTSEGDKLVAGEKKSFEYNADLLPKCVNKQIWSDGRWETAVEASRYEWDRIGNCSISVSPESETMADFDEYGRLVNFMKKNFENRDGERILVERYEWEYVYNERGNKTISISKRFRNLDKPQEEWTVSGSRRDVTYVDVPGYGEDIAAEMWYELGPSGKEWIESELYEYSYTLSGDDILCRGSISYYDRSHGVWVKSQSSDSSGRYVADGLYYILNYQNDYIASDNGVETLNGRVEQTIAENVDGYPYQIVQVTKAYGSNADGTLYILNEMKSSHYFDITVNDGKRELRKRKIVYEKWDNAIGDFWTWKEDVFDYDASGKPLVESEVEYYNAVGLVYPSSYKKEYTYDRLGRLVEMNYLKGSSYTGVLETCERTEYKYYEDTQAPLSAKIYNVERPDTPYATTVWEYDYSVPSPKVCVWGGTAPADQVFLCTSKTETTDYGRDKVVTRYTYADRSDLSGVEGVAAEAVAEGAAEYYDLRGVRVAAPNLAPGLYIRRQGTSATKVLIR